MCMVHCETVNFYFYGNNFKQYLRLFTTFISPQVFANYCFYFLSYSSFKLRTKNVMLKFNVLRNVNKLSLFCLFLPGNLEIFFQQSLREQCEIYTKLGEIIKQEFYTLFYQFHITKVQDKRAGLITERVSSEQSQSARLKRLFNLLFQLH